MEWEGLDELVANLEMTERKLPKVIEKLEEDVAGVILEDVIENTPVDTGDLQKAWKLRQADGIEIYNDAKNKEEYYAWDVEYGHRTRAGMNLKQSTRRKKKAYSKGGKITFVPGVFMLKGAFKIGQTELEEKGKKAVEEILGDLNA